MHRGMTSEPGGRAECCFKFYKWVLRCLPGNSLILSCCGTRQARVFPEVDNCPPQTGVFKYSLHGNSRSWTLKFKRKM
eukprot:scaffold87869_cov20-Tisochrysis_lutea.AAC.1